MAVRTPTWTWREVIIAARDAARADISGERQAMAANLALNTIWMAHDWNESLAEFDPFYLSPNEQDYGAPAVAVPSDMLGVRFAYFVDLRAGGQSGNEFRREIRCPKSNLYLTYQVGEPQMIGYEGSTRSLRIFPRASTDLTAPWCFIDGKYKKRPTKITEQTLPTATILFDDLYLHPHIEAVKWALMMLANNPNANGIQRRGKTDALSGQYAVMMNAIDWMAEKEQLQSGQPIMAPREQLVAHVD